MFSSNQLLELLVVLCIADHCRYTFSRIGNACAQAQSKSGSIRPDSMPTRLSMLITPLQGLTYFVVPTVYIGSVVVAGLEQPRWVSSLALPDTVYGVALEGVHKNVARVLACVLSIALRKLSDDVFEHLDDQFHTIGRRKASRIVQTGPFAWVRHPLYAVSLMHPGLWTIMFWSSVPLVVVVATAAVYVVKIPIEEEAILRDDAVKEEYRAYMRKVPARLIPYVW